MSITPIPKSKRGRPTGYTLELAKIICDEIACSSKGLRRLCQENPHWPEPRTIYRWLNQYPEFCQHYARAKRIQVEVLVDEIIEISDCTENDAVITQEGDAVCNTEHIARSRLRVDSRKWIACKLVPKVYGERISVHSIDQEMRNRSMDRIRETLIEYEAY